MKFNLQGMQAGEIVVESNNDSVYQYLLIVHIRNVCSI